VNLFFAHYSNSVGQHAGDQKGSNLSLIPPNPLVRTVLMLHSIKRNRSV